MTLIVLTISSAFIAGAQCFYVFNLYKKLTKMNITLEAILSGFVTPRVEIEAPKIAGANRRARTEAEKQAASLKKKEWWEKKRASDALKQ